MKRVSLSLCTVVCILAASGCSKRDQQEMGNALEQTGEKTGNTLKQAGKATVSTLKDIGNSAEKKLKPAINLTGDAAITGTVKTRLLADKWISATGIDVTTKNNIVTLTGKIGSQQQKVRASKIAKETTKVRGVVNKLQIGK
ncbi:MAG TPA: BON domain-containing protein [Abditibacteriaceae bacterium]|jgi:hyperosmotically inducible protein